MDYVLVNDKLSAVLLSNRCAAYLNLKRYENALEDAERCVQIEPDWSKVQYLFLSCCFNCLEILAQMCCKIDVGRKAQPYAFIKVP